jgi:hypothetical protein
VEKTVSAAEGGKFACLEIFCIKNKNYQETWILGLGHREKIIVILRIS